mgnify:CR=1 FL=1
MKTHLFIAGCPRSGTSALVQLLSRSKKVVMGMERYGHLVGKSNFTLTPAHFEKERFFTMEEGDTFYKDVLDFHKFSPDMYEKYDNCTIVGDKRPNLYESYDELFEHFPDAKVLFIYRDIERVASSYAARVQEGKSWPITKDFKSAVIEWNQSLYFTREALKKGYDIKVVDYDTLFISGDDLQNLFKYLDLQNDEDLHKGLLDIRMRSKQLIQERKMLLTNDELEFVKDNAKQFLIDDISHASLFK